ncbi:MAG TPA: hypothetical protein C5S37_06155 [Methanophagales archaeon]|nr:hypothetical protein [Methanophagales archaeon]
MEGKRRRFKKLGGDKMKKEYLIIATITLVVLILASSVPAMQSTSIPEYPPICPEESYNKITELYEEGLSEDEIAEELAFPLDIVNRYLNGNYTPPPCPESNQSISPSDCPTYSKIKDLYGEGWSEEEIAEKLELPLDVVCGFLSGNYTIISSCPKPYQKSEEEVTTQKSMESISLEKTKESITPGKTMKNVTPEKSMEQWRQEHTVRVKAIRTLKYEQGYLEIKEIYTSEEFKKRFGRDNFTKELRIPVSADDAKKIAEINGIRELREGEEITISITEEERVFTTVTDPPHWWNYYHYPPWCYSEDEGVYTEVDPINMAWENTNINTVKAEITEEGWEDPVFEHTFYVSDPEQGGSWKEQTDSLATCCWYTPRNHIRLWSLSTGDVAGQAHHDALSFPSHYADEYEPAEELVAGYYKEPDDTQWKVYDDNYNLYTEYTNPHGAYNDGWCTQTYYILPSLEEAVDNTALSWDTGGRVDGFGQTSTYYYGSDAAQSGTISHNQESWVQTTVTGPGTLKFYWKVSSEANWDFLRFYIDGVEQERISGNVDWQQKTYGISSGSHTLKWAYTKDGSVNRGSDCGWLDKVEFTPSGGDLITSESGTLSGTGDTYTFSVSGYSTVTVVMAGNENADFDLYAKWGSPPTTSDYDARGYSGTSLEYFTTSGSGTLYIMVRSCSGSGHWKCWALSGSPGADSGRKSGTLSGTGDTDTYSLSGTGIGYAFNSGPDSSDFDLYTKWNSPPTTSDYDARGYSGWAQEIAGPASGSGTLYFMVRSYSGSGGYATVELIF